MKLGRNLTNVFTIEVLSDEQSKDILDGKEDLFSLNAFGIIKMKSDINHIIDVAKKINVHHIELDCDTPSPYIEFSKKEREELKNKFTENGITLSVHLPYTMSAVSNIASLQELERKTAEEIAKKYIDFAIDIKAESIVIHPGKIPFYFASKNFFKMLEEQIVKTLYNLAIYIKNSSDIKFHIENNTAFDGFYYNIEDCLRIVKNVRELGGEIYFNFDIGHWFTKEKIGETLPDNFLEEIKKIPAEFVYEFHLNDYIVSEGIFHPPLIEQKGKLKKEVLKKYADIIKNLNVKLLVLETAFHSIEQIKSRYEIIKNENRYIEEIFNERW